MRTETKIHSTSSVSANCQQCKKDFEITPEDFSFYEKIKVPPPTFCPECRLVSMFVEANERTLYKRKCDLTGKDIFSMFPADAPFPVYETDAWYSDSWDAYKYGQNYDFSRSFFEQYLELQNKVPRMALVRQGMAINSPYTNRLTDPKNSYMVFRASYPENCMFLYNAINTRDSCDSIWLYNSELCYECVNCDNSYNLKFCQESKDCRDSQFLFGCRNSSNCVGCVNLVNGEYCIFNQKYTKEEYFEKIKELKLNTASGIESMQVGFEEFRKKFPIKSIASIKSEQVSGNWFVNCKNVLNSFDCDEVKDGKYLYSVFKAEDCMDLLQWGNKAEQVYNSANCGINVARLNFCTQCWTGATDLFYCNTCPGARNCFGCFGLNKGEYAILNKKYSKEEYEEMLPKVIEHMKVMPYKDEHGRVYSFGEHFPVSFSDFAYNETPAQDFFPLTKEKTLEQGYRWKEREKKNYETTIKGSDLPETIQEVDDSILNQIIECADKENPFSVGAYRITQNELSFYRRMDLPLPRVCFDVRHMRRITKRTPYKLIKRYCSKCSVQVDTAYTEDYAPILYCEQCYQQEVY